MKVFNGKLSEALVNQVQFTFRCDCFEPEGTEKHIFNNPVIIMSAIVFVRFKV